MNKVKCAFCVSFEMFFLLNFILFTKKIQFVRAKTLYMKRHLKYARMYSNRLTMSFDCNHSINVILVQEILHRFVVIIEFLLRIKSVGLRSEYSERDDFKLS